MSMFNDSYGDLQTMNGNAVLTTMDRNVLLMPHFVSLFAKSFPAGRWSFLGPGSEKKWYSTHGGRPQGELDRVAENYLYNSVPKGIRLNLFSHNYFC